MEKSKDSLMGLSGRSKLQKILHRKIRRSFIRTKHCFILSCKNSTIKSHSISKARILEKISKHGEVMFMSTEDVENHEGFSLFPTGKAKATTFPGFCDKHDKIFEPIDAHQYEAGNLEQEFLFAMRAAAREYTVRIAMQDNLEEIVREHESAENEGEGIGLSNEGLEDIKLYKIGFTAGTKELERLRINIGLNFRKKKYKMIRTETLVIKGEFPLVASSCFKLEIGSSGKTINSISRFSDKGKPTFFTLFPQSGKTYCLISWQRMNNKSYKDLVGLNLKTQKEKKVIVSNLLTSYVENFAANPDYWESLPKKVQKTFREYWAESSFLEVVPFIFDPEFSLFI